jgi:site-specific DNA-adenine methylase
MRNKRHIQQSLVVIESIQQSLIQFIRNVRLEEQERHFLEKQIEESKRAFDQVRTYINQEEDDFRS